MLFPPVIFISLLVGISWQQELCKTPLVIGGVQAAIEAAGCCLLFKAGSQMHWCYGDGKADRNAV